MDGKLLFCPRAQKRLLCPHGFSSLPYSFFYVETATFVQFMAKIQYNTIMVVGGNHMHVYKKKKEKTLSKLEDPCAS